MKTSRMILTCVVGCILGGCSATATDCANQQCETASTRSYHLCVSTTSETWNFGSASCTADIANSGQVQGCAIQVASYCSGLDGGTIGGGDAGCSYVVTGAQTSSGSCTAQALNAAGIRFSVSAASTFEFVATFTGQNTLNAGVFDNSVAAPGGYNAQYNAGTSVYTMCSSVANCGGGSPQGSFTLTVTDPGPETQPTADQTEWLAPKGNLVVTMPAQPDGGASGSVTVTVTL